MREAESAINEAARPVSLPRVAVLPFHNSSGHPEQDYFCEGIAAEILICLARTPGISVVARSAVFDVDWEKLGVCETGQALGATAVLKGEVYKSDDRLSIRVELVDVMTCQPVWTGQFEQEALDVFVIQDDIIASVIEALPVSVDDGRVKKIHERHGRNLDAYRYYLRGRHFYWHFSRTGIETALGFFNLAIEEDDEYALAYCGVADCYWYLYMYVASNDDYLDKADVASLRALEFSPDLAEAHASRGVALSLLNRFDNAATEFERAIELDPTLFEARFLFARACFAEGEIERAAKLFVAANRVRPEDYQSLLLAGQAYEVLGESDKAADYRKHGVAIAEEHLFLNPNECRALYMGANGLVSLGEIERGLEWAERALEAEPDDPMMLYNVGCIYALVGRNADALDCLERAVGGGLRQRGWFANDPNLDGVRHEPRFQELEKRLV